MTVLNEDQRALRDAVRELALSLPRSYEALVRGRVKFRVGRIVYLAFSRDEELMGFAFPKEEREALIALIRNGWGRDNPAFRQVFTSLFVPGATPEQMQWFNDLQRVSTSPENAVRLQRVFGDIDATELLPQVRVPTLVLHSRNDALIPLEQGLMLARAIPNARLVALESRNHIILSHEPAWSRFIGEICDFLT